MRGLTPVSAIAYTAMSKGAYPSTSERVPVPCCWAQESQPMQPCNAVSPQPNPIPIKLVGNQPRYTTAHYRAHHVTIERKPHKLYSVQLQPPVDSMGHSHDAACKTSSPKMGWVRLRGQTAKQGPDSCLARPWRISSRTLELAWN